MRHEIISRTDALLQGKRTFFTGEPCKHGHVTVRYTANNSCRACNRVSAARPRNITRQLWLWARQRANKRGIEFCITEDHVLVTQNCPCCNVPFRFTKQRPKLWETDAASLDRMKPELGYVPGNVWVICRGCNTSKADNKFEKSHPYLLMSERSDSTSITIMIMGEPRTYTRIGS